MMEDASAFDWSHFTRYALACEKETREEPGEEDIQMRHRLIRQRIRSISRCDIFADDPLLGSSLGPYGVVAHTFCLDSIIQDKRVVSPQPEADQFGRYRWLVHRRFSFTCVLLDPSRHEISSSDTHAR